MVDTPGISMIAIKPLTYATRQLVAGDEFTVFKRNDARILAGIKKAKFKDIAPETPAPAKKPARKRKAAKK